MNTRGIIKVFLRLAIGIAFLSAVADRFGIWGDAWGNMANFHEYTHQLMPWMSIGLAKVSGWIATIVELICGIALIVGWKVRLFANISGVLLLLFAVAMWSSLGLKAPLNYSVFGASAASFALASLRGKYLEF